MDLLKSIFKGDKVIWIIFLCLCLISIIEVFSAASTLTYKSGDHWGPITQHTIRMMLCCVIGPQWSPLLYVSVDAALNTSTIEMRQRKRNMIQITLSPLNMLLSKSNASQINS